MKAGEYLIVYKFEPIFTPSSPTRVYDSSTPYHLLEDIPLKDFLEDFECFMENALLEEEGAKHCLVDLNVFTMSIQRID